MPKNEELGMQDKCLKVSSPESTVLELSVLAIFLIIWVCLRSVLTGLQEYELHLRSSAGFRFGGEFWTYEVDPETCLLQIVTGDEAWTHYLETM
jgi:hypothetical protein